MSTVPELCDGQFEKVRAEEIIKCLETLEEELLFISLRFLFSVSLPRFIFPARPIESIRLR